MVFRRFFAAVLFLVVLSLIAVELAEGRRSGQTPDLSSLSDADLKAVTIHFERTGCYGDCPSYTVTIHGDGRLEYTGNKYVKVTGEQKGRIASEAVKALVQEFARAKFLSLPESYQKCACRQCTDMPSAITELVAPGVKHRVDHYYGCACTPKALFELESAIDKAVNSEQWTGDVSKHGPFGSTCIG